MAYAVRPLPVVGKNMTKFDVIFNGKILPCFFFFVFIGNRCRINVVTFLLVDSNRTDVERLFPRNKAEDETVPTRICKKMHTETWRITLTEFSMNLF